MDQNVELMSSFVKYLQFRVLTRRSSIRGKGCGSGTIILLRSLKSMHNRIFLPSSFLKANVIGAAKGLYDSSNNFFSRSFAICCSIYLFFSIVHLYGLLLQYLSICKLIRASLSLTVPTSNLSFANIVEYLFIKLSIF